MKTHKYSKIHGILVFTVVFTVMTAQFFLAVSAWVKLSNPAPLTQAEDTEPFIVRFNALPGCFEYTPPNTLTFLPLNNYEIWENGAYVIFVPKISDYQSEGKIIYEITIINGEKDNNHFQDISYTSEYNISELSALSELKDLIIGYKLMPGDILAVSGNGFFEVFPVISDEDESENLDKWTYVQERDHTDIPKSVINEENNKSNDNSEEETNDITYTDTENTENTETDEPDSDIADIADIAVNTDNTDDIGEDGEIAETDKNNETDDTSEFD